MQSPFLLALHICTMLLGETISLFVALSWTITALFAEVGSKRMGSLPFNVVRMSISLLFLSITVWLTMGTPYPRFADASTWIYLLLSGIVGYVIGDYCLMQGYILIGSRFGQLFMTLSAPSAALTALLFLGERMRVIAIVGMIITLTGIILSVFSKDGGDSHSVHLKLPLKGVFYAAMAGIGQGIGLVISKVGLLHYEDAVSSVGLSEMSVPDGALLHVPLSISIPFAATLIRAYIGLVGFFVVLIVFNQDGLKKLHRAVSDRKAMLCVLGSTVFGPFLGVSASLLATLYTNVGIAQTIFALTPVLIIAPAALLFKQRVTFWEVVGAIISVVGVSLFFVA